jgi:hypothetical protein
MNTHAGVVDEGWAATERTMAATGDPLLYSVLDYWDHLRGPRAMPPRREIDPIALPRPSLPHLFLVRVEGNCFRFGLVGTSIEQQFGTSLGGHLVQDLPFGADGAASLAQYLLTVETQRPTYREHEFVNRQAVTQYCRRLLLPLSADGVTVTDLLGMWVFLPRRPWGAKTTRGCAGL